MKKYSETINKLLTQEEMGGYFYFSCYLPIKDKSKKEINKKIKFVFKDAFADNLKTKRLKKIPRTIISKATSWVENQERLNKGIAFFCKFKKKNDLKKAVKDENLIIVSLQRAPKKEASLGKTYDLDQLIWINNSNLDSLIFHIERIKADIYFLDRRKLKKIKKIDNDYAKREKDEALDKYTAVQDKGAFFGMGKDTRDKRHKKQNQLFLNKIIKELKEDKKLSIHFESLVVFYSHSFDKIIENFKDKLRRQAKCSWPIFVNKVFKKKELLRKEAIRKLKKHKKKLKKKFLEKIKEEEHDLYVEGWEKVAEASRDKKIDTLFIDPLAKKDGYVFQKDLVYTFVKKEARKVGNIGPWIVKSVIKSSGQVVVFQDKFKELPEIAARLRY